MRIEPLPYDPRSLYDIPAWVIENIQAVSAYMKTRGHEEWTIAGVRSQAAHAREVEALRLRVEVVEADARRFAWWMSNDVKHISLDEFKAMAARKATLDEWRAAIYAAISAERDNTRSDGNG